jgi:hypothetical protein
MENCELLYMESYIESYLESYMKSYMELYSMKPLVKLCADTDKPLHIPQIICFTLPHAFDCLNYKLYSSLQAI